MSRLKFIYLGVLISIFFICFLRLFSPIKIVRILSDSMSPALEAGDIILISMVKSPRYNDIIAFHGFTNTNQNEILIKRVVGLPGDELLSRSGTIYNNNIIIGKSDEDFNLVVPQGKFYVLGDNSANSVDSRFWDEVFVDKSDILGVVIYHFRKER